jgi:hypothetical protein
MRGMDVRTCVSTALGRVGNNGLSFQAKLFYEEHHLRMTTTRSIRHGEQIVCFPFKFTHDTGVLTRRHSGTHMATLPTRTYFAGMGTSIRSHLPMADLGTLPILSRFALIMLWILFNINFRSKRARGALTVSIGG